MENLFNNPTKPLNIGIIVLIIMLTIGILYGGYSYIKAQTQPSAAKGSDNKTFELPAPPEGAALKDDAISRGIMAKPKQGNEQGNVNADLIRNIARANLDTAEGRAQFFYYYWNPLAKQSAGARYFKGDNYPAVACIQKLFQKDANPPLTVDGNWGASTDKAITLLFNLLSDKNNPYWSLKMLEVDIYADTFENMMVSDHVVWYATR
jgi:hypothetical protein